MSDLANDKLLLRKRILALREQLSSGLRTAHSAAITARLLQLPDYQQANVVLGYMSFGSEFNSTAWVSQVLTNGKELLLPKVNRQSGQLDLYQVDNLANQLAPGLWGISEPIPERCERFNRLNEVEFALLPGVAFTRNGARLGYGGGFYDKLFAHVALGTPLVAAAFALQVVQRIPQEPTDIKVGWIMTEQECIDCQKHPG